MAFVGEQADDWLTRKGHPGNVMGECGRDGDGVVETWVNLCLVWPNLTYIETSVSLRRDGEYATHSNHAHQVYVVQLTCNDSEVALL